MPEIAAAVSPQELRATIEKLGPRVPQPTEIVDVLAIQRGTSDAKRVVLITGHIELGTSTLEGLLQRVYDDVPAGLHGVALRSLLAHLLKLRDDGLASELQGRWSA